MYNFYVLKGRKFINYKPTKEHYARALLRLTKEFDSYGDLDFQELKNDYPDKFKRFLYLLIKYVGCSFNSNKVYGEKEIREWFSFIETVSYMIAYMTPKEFAGMFPIEKTYDGAKYECKDYFYTKEYVADFGEDVQIGNDKVEEFLFAYQNWDINFYMVAWMGIVNRMHQVNGGRDMLVEFFEEQGTPLHTYHKEGNVLVDDETGERYEIRKPKNSLRKLFSVVSNEQEGM